MSSEHIQPIVTICVDTVKFESVFFFFFECIYTLFCCLSEEIQSIERAHIAYNDSIRWYCEFWVIFFFFLLCIYTGFRCMIEKIQYFEQVHTIETVCIDIAKYESSSFSSLYVFALLYCVVWERIYRLLSKHIELIVTVCVDTTKFESPFSSSLYAYTVFHCLREKYCLLSEVYTYRGSMKRIQPIVIVSSAIVCIYTTSESIQVIQNRRKQNSIYE